jgi:hypothetical protein
MKSVAILAAVGAAGLVAASSSAAPPGPPPKVKDAKAAPPAAWLETPTSSSWLAFSSYCWRERSTRKAVCVDMILPQSRQDLPSVRVRAGTTVRLHLGYKPREVHVTTFVGDTFTHKVLRPRRVTSWRPTVSGVVSFDVRAAEGSAAYVAQINVVR